MTARAQWDRVSYIKISAGSDWRKGRVSFDNVGGRSGLLSKPMPTPSGVRAVFPLWVDQVCPENWVVLEIILLDNTGLLWSSY